MEKENAKFRSEKRKELNDCVRALVAFVRKRDKRVAAHTEANEAAKAAKQSKAAEERKARQAAYDAELVAAIKAGVPLPLAADVPATASGCPARSGAPGSPARHVAARR